MSRSAYRECEGIRITAVLMEHAAMLAEVQGASRVRWHETREWVEVLAELQPGLLQVRTLSDAEVLTCVPEQLMLPSARRKILWDVLKDQVEWAERSGGPCAAGRAS